MFVLDGRIIQCAQARYAYTFSLFDIRVKRCDKYNHVRGDCQGQIEMTAFSAAASHSNR